MNYLIVLRQLLSLTIFVLTLCGRLSADELAPSVIAPGVSNAIEVLSQSAAWNHLDPDWLASVEAATADGPELNVLVQLVSADGQPITGAVVAIQESIYEAASRVSLQAKPFQPVRAISVTNENGICRFDAVATTLPGTESHGRIKAYVVIAHPKYGFDYYPLFRTSRDQRAEITMRRQVSLPAVVRGGAQPQEIRVTRLGQSEASILGRRGFVADAMFAPRASVDPQGQGTFESLPVDQFIGFQVRDERGWSSTVLRGLVSANAELAEIDLRDATVRGQIQFIDPLTGKPISNVSVDRWKHPQQISDDEGRITIRPSLPEKVFHLGGVAKLQFNIEPPPRFVRESVLQYPHRSGSGTQPYYLIPATTMSGRVVDAKTGEGISSVVVQSIMRRQRPGGIISQFHAVAVSKEDGSFSLSVPPGRQTLSVATPVPGYLQPREQRVSIIDGKFVKQQTIRLTPAEPIRGRIVDSDGKPVTGAEVICHSGDRVFGRYRAGIPLEATIAVGLTDEDGEFAIDRPTGQYNSLMVKAFADDRQSRDALIDFDPESNRPLEVDLELSLGEPSRRVELVGRVLKDGAAWHGAIVTADPPLNHRRQGASHLGRSNDRGTSQLGETTTDERGRYQLFVDVSDFETIRIGIRAGRRVQSTTKKFVRISGSRIEVPQIEIREKPGDQTIKGIVVDPSGLPVANVRVSAQQQRAFASDLRNWKDNPHSVMTNTRGEFTLRELYDGPVEVVVSPANVPTRYAVLSELLINAGEQNAEVIFDRSLSRIPKMITPLETRSLTLSDERIDFRADGGSLDPATRVRGVVVDQRGKPVDDAIVRVFCVMPSDLVSNNNPLAHPACRIATKTNSQGQFEIGPFPRLSKVRIAAGGTGFLASVTEFLSLGKQGSDTEIQLTRIDPNLPAMKTTHQLIDSSGKPVPGAVVSTSYQSYQDILDFSSGSGPCVLTDGRGMFRFPTVAGVDYLTIAAIPIVGPACVIDNNYSHRKYPLLPTMSIRGRVVDPTGRPLKRFILTVRNDRTIGYIRVATDSNGVFQVDQLPCDKESIIDGHRLTEPQLTLLKQRFASSPGKKTDLGDLVAIPRTSLAVNVVAASGKMIPTELAIEIGATSTKVPADGKIAFDNIGPGLVNMKMIGSAAVDRTQPPLQMLMGNTFVLDAAVTDRVEIYLK
ncbi:MAG: carboxypeptidase regulatory-like domain-containing protein [Planctomycetota bacterium]